MSGKKETKNTYAETFRDIAELWHKIKSPSWKPKYSSDNLQKMDNHILPLLGERFVVNLEKKDIYDFLMLYIEQEKIAMAKKLLVIISGIMEYACVIGVIKHNPCTRLSSSLPKYEATPYPAITDPLKVGKLLCNMRTYKGCNFTVRNAMIASLYLFCRPVETRQMQWKEIDFEKSLWTIPPERMKTNKEQLVPLSHQVLAIIKEQGMFYKNSPFVFPSPHDRNSPLSENAVRGALRRLGYAKEEIVPHGFRSTASTLLNEDGGYRGDAIEKQLSHAIGNKMRTIYNRAAYLAERTPMMQEYADMLDGLAEKAL